MTRVMLGRPRRAAAGVLGRPRRTAAAVLGLALVLLLALVLVVPGAALAVTSTAANPIGSGLPASPGNAVTTATATSPQIVATTTASSGAGVAGGEAIAIAAAALIIIVGIGYAILRDARRRTKRGPVKDTLDRTPGSQRPPKGRKLSSAERKRRKRGRNPRRR